MQFFSKNQKRQGSPVDQEKNSTYAEKPKQPSKLKRLNNFWLAMVIGLGLTLVAFEWRTPENGIDQTDDTFWEDQEYVTEIIPVTMRKPEKVELSEPRTKTSSSGILHDVKIDDGEFEDRRKKELSKYNTSFNDQIDDDLFNDDNDGDDVTIIGDPFSIPIELESTMPLFCNCAHLTAKEDKEQCNYLEIQKFLQKNLRYPVRLKDEGKQGIAVVEYVVDQQGKIANVAVKNPTEKAFAKEAERVVKLLPCMKPAKQHNRSVAVTYKIPIRFVLKN